MPENKIDEKTPLPYRSEEWLQGWNDFNEGKALSDNPYIAEEESLKYARWIRGWEAASYNNAK